MTLAIDNRMWEEIVKGMGESLYMTGVSSIIAYLIGIPIGVILAITAKESLIPNKPLNFILGLIVNILRSVPFVILAIFIIPFTRKIVGTSIGATAMIVPLTITAFPFAARMVESSVKEVPKGKIEAAQAMGSSNMQIILKVILPESKPSLITGAAITIATLLGYTAMAGFIAGGGLGTIAINYGYYRYKEDVMLVCVILLVIIVQVFQELGLFLSKKLDNRKRA